MSALAQQHVSAFTIKANGQALDNTLLTAITEIKVRQSVRSPSSASIRITDPKGEHMDDHPLQIGVALEISMGAMESNQPVKVFVGEVVALEPEFDEAGITIGVRAYDKLHRLQRAKKVRTFQQVSASDMVTKIMNEAGIAGSARSTTPVFPFFQQSDETDRDFIRRLERMQDFELAMEDGSYVFRDATSTAAPAAELKYGDSLLTFRPRLTAAQQDFEVEVRGWDSKTKQAAVGTEDTVPEPAQIGITRDSLKTKFGSNRLIVSDRSAATQSEAQALAKATLKRRAAAFLEAEGTTFGNPAIKAGCILKLSQLGQKFSGQYPVTAVTHSMRSPGTFKTHFEVSGRSDRGLLDLVHPPVPRVWGQSMVVGIVTNNNDPDALGRVRVKYPALSDSEEGDWARVLSHNITKGRGIFMLPQVDDEVVVAFENGDTRRPLIIGSVVNGKDKPTSELLPDQKGGLTVLSDDRGFVHTKEDLTFKSDKKMIIEVASDQEVKTDGKVTNKTSSSVEMKAGSSYTLEAGSSMSIKGATIAVEASGSLKLKGATVEIESQGPATLKGAIVDINASGIANLKGSMVNIG